MHVNVISVNVVRVNTHYIAVSSSVEIPYRQALHLVEHIVTQISQIPLCERRAELPKKEVCHPADRVNGKHYD